MQCIYVGRLEKEKGIESIIWLITYMHKNNMNNFHIEIFGKGLYSNNIEKLAKEYPKLLTYHGRKNKKEIQKIRIDMDYFIMPSTFLETFWLTACESLTLWVPVIGHKKGWLIPFIDDELDISTAEGENDTKKLINIVSQLLTSQMSKESFSDIVKNAKREYTIQNRTNSINNFIPTSINTILMVSDFINYNGWGVETHIHDVKEILWDQYKVSIYGHQAPTDNYARIKKFILMLLSISNIKDSIQISKKIQKENIWLIWRHSISRVIGRLPIAWINRGKYKHRKMQHIMTHHELWIFHPFASRVTDINQLPKARSLSSFIRTGQTNNIVIKLGICGKYFLLWLLHKQLQKTIQTHIVPSERMRPMVQSWYPHANIIVLPHFVHTTDLS